MYPPLQQPTQFSINSEPFNAFDAVADPDQETALNEMFGPFAIFAVNGALVLVVSALIQSKTKQGWGAYDVF